MKWTAEVSNHLALERRSMPSTPRTISLEPPWSAPYEAGLFYLELLDSVCAIHIWSDIWADLLCWGAELILPWQRTRHWPPFNSVDSILLLRSLPSCCRTQTQKPQTAWASREYWRLTSRAWGPSSCTARPTSPPWSTRWLGERRVHLLTHEAIHA